MSGNNIEAQSGTRSFAVAMGLVIAVAFTGFFVGIRQKVVPERAVSNPRPVATMVGDAVTYSERPARVLGPNRDYEVRIEAAAAEEALALTGVDLALPTAQQRAQALSDRRQRRAYAGAPPMVPHPVDQRSATSCLACHGEGVQLASLKVPKMSHEFRASCTQCHAEQQASGLQPRENPGSSGFVGLAEGGGGGRAWDGAPPTIPHALKMREDCLSCHGLGGREGLRSPHPWRASCLQCHGTSAELDQRQFLPPGPRAGAFPQEK